MAVRSHLRGHRIDYLAGQWRYSDTGELADYDRPCIHCGEMPTAEGYDACIGYIPGMLSVCCGHGIHSSIYWRIMRQAKDIEFRGSWFSAGIRFYPYQGGIGIAVSFWPPDYRPELSIHFGPLKLWFGINGLQIFEKMKILLTKSKLITEKGVVK